MVSSKEYNCGSTDELASVAESIINDFSGVKTILLDGDLGSGKTAFVKAFCRILEVKEEVTSPTFSIIHEYTGSMKVSHFDLYRLKNRDELFQIGFEEYLSSEGYKLIEWPGLAIELIDGEYITMNFMITGPLSRLITATLHNS